jgi:SsrA-binding protein
VSEISTNRKALRDFHILERYEAGLQLRGTEVKSIRQGKVNISDAFARIDKDQVWLYNCDVQIYDKASHVQHEPRRTRKLLLNKREIHKLISHSLQKGLALPVLKMYWKGSLVKVEIGVGRGKTKGDQRQDIKERTENREAAREVARFNERAKK